MLSPYLPSRLVLVSLICKVSVPSGHELLPSGHELLGHELLPWSRITPGHELLPAKFRSRLEDVKKSISQFAENSA
jgi:hypothetical protein